MPQEQELGGPIYDVKYRGGEAIVKFGRDVERQWRGNDRRGPMPMAPAGSHIRKTADDKMGKRMRGLAKLDPPKSPAKVAVDGRSGEPLTVRIAEERSGVAGLASSSENGKSKFNSIRTL